MAFPGTYNFSYYRGDTYEFVITPKNIDGSSFDLTTYDTITFTIATARGSGATQYTGIAQKSSDEKTIVCRITPTNGNNLLSSNTYVYDVQISKGTGNTQYTYTLLTGSISVTEQVSA